jgi:glycine cleavage system H protein
VIAGQGAAIAALRLPHVRHAIESVKSVSDLIAPVTGTIRTRNGDLASTPELVNSDPYGRGWMFEAEADSASPDRQLADLMDARAYRDLIGA